MYDPDPGGPITNLLLVAGGVGINPLLSMLKHNAELLDSGHWSSAVSLPKAYLLYSAKETDELVFKVRTLHWKYAVVLFASILTSLACGGSVTSLDC